MSLPGERLAIGTGTVLALCAWVAQGAGGEVRLRAERVDDVLQANVACGPNSLYVLLALHGIEVPYDVVSECLPDCATGSSLLELRRASAEFGLPLEARDVSLEE